MNPTIQPSTHPFIQRGIRVFHDLTSVWRRVRWKNNSVNPQPHPPQHCPVEPQIEFRRRRVAGIHRGIGANEIRKRRPVDQITGSGKDATDTLEL